MCDGEIMILLTQDAIPADEHLIENLINDLMNNLVQELKNR